jgi:dTDP-4-dehydrorhamnose reductase
MKVLVIGQGLLGSELVKQTNWNYISRKKHGIDFTDPSTYLSFIESHDTIINCVAITDTYGNKKQECRNVNYKAVADLSDICEKQNKKLVHISTDYVYAGSTPIASEDALPIISPNWYTYYKLLADEYIMLKNSNYLICRCSFKPNPFPYDSAWIDQVGNFDYVDVISGLIIKLIENDSQGLFNVGTELKSIYELAKQTNPNVNKIVKLGEAPNNISMNLLKLNSII